MSGYIPNEGDRNTFSKYTWGQLWRIKKCANRAWEATRKLYPGWSWEDGPGDAFRHMYWSALMTKELGPSIAKYVGDQHENVEGNPADRKSMDLHNNHLGRQIAMRDLRASEAVLSKECQTAVRQGRAMIINKTKEDAERQERLRGGPNL